MDIFKTLALKGARIVIKELLETGSIRYTELQEAVGSPSTTNLALFRLLEEGLIRKQVLNEPYRPVAYSLTKQGRKIAKFMEQIESVSRKENKPIQ